MLEPLSFALAAGETLALVGPSGCGKSTLLHLVAGLLEPSSGNVQVAGERVRRPGPTRTLMFQEHALYPWLTLQANVALALEFQAVARPEAARRAQDWLARVELAGFEGYYPHQVSGGMKQRAAIARALIAEPKVLLLDEPFGALDALTRLSLQSLLGELVRELGTTTLLVTHDVEEALLLADRVFVLSKRPGRVLADLRITPGAHAEPKRAELKHHVLELLGLGSPTKPAPPNTPPHRSSPQEEVHA